MNVQGDQYTDSPSILKVCEGKFEEAYGQYTRGASAIVGHLSASGLMEVIFLDSRPEERHNTSSRFVLNRGVLDWSGFELTNAGKTYDIAFFLKRVS